MISYGKNIISANDPLIKIEPEALFKIISSPDSQLQSQLQQLRTVMSIDPKKYNQLKRMLPYVVCGIFHPPYRRLENFASIQYFMLDIDHLAEKGIEAQNLRNKLKADPRVHLLFTSPGGNGLKVLFRLAQKCFDRQQYTVFYKLFVHQISAQYALDQVIDKVTSDATRACFLSADGQAHFNPEALAINMNEYINFDSHEQVQQAVSLIKEVEVKPPAEEKARELTPDLLAEIKKKLNPNIRTAPPKDYFVPGEVDAIMDELKKEVEKMGIELRDAQPIQYGRKIRFYLNDRWAQLNLFYGKKGYKIVKTPVTNSNNELAEVVYRILCGFFYGTENDDN
ncbi:MAG: CRISPR-associated primase-polymerase type B [Bacteroidales bacterium]